MSAQPRRNSAIPVTAITADSHSMRPTRSASIQAAKAVPKRTLVSLSAATGPVGPCVNAKSTSRDDVYDTRQARKPNRHWFVVFQTPIAFRQSCWKSSTTNAIRSSAESGRDSREDAGRAAPRETRPAEVERVYSSRRVAVEDDPQRP